MSALALIIRGILIPIVWMGSGFAMAVAYDKYKEKDKINKMTEKRIEPQNASGGNVTSTGNFSKIESKQ